MVEALYAIAYVVAAVVAVASLPVTLWIVWQFLIIRRAHERLDSPRIDEQERRRLRLAARRAALELDERAE